VNLSRLKSCSLVLRSDSLYLRPFSSAETTQQQLLFRQHFPWSLALSVDKVEAIKALITLFFNGFFQYYIVETLNKTVKVSQWLVDPLSDTGRLWLAGAELSKWRSRNNRSASQWEERLWALRWLSALLWHHKVPEVLTACFKAQFLNTGCVHFSVDWGFDTFTVLI